MSEETEVVVQVAYLTVQHVDGRWETNAPIDKNYRMSRALHPDDFIAGAGVAVKDVGVQEGSMYVAQNLATALPDLVRNVIRQELRADKFVYDSNELAPFPGDGEKSVTQNTEG